MRDRREILPSLLPILINKADLVAPAELHRLGAILASLNPVARIAVSVQGQVQLDQVLGTGLFDMERAQQAAGWTVASALVVRTC